MPKIQTHKLSHHSGIELELLNYGARIHTLKIPYKNKKINIVLSYPHIDNYLQDKFYVGATIGRFCNRIHGGEISISQKKYKLPMNEITRSNTLHGGDKGFDKCFWEVYESTETSIEFQLLSPHLDQGFPGNLDVRAIYTIDDLSFSVEYTAVCDQDTVVNLCNHTYFNLNGFNNLSTSTITDHLLSLHSDKYLPLTENNVPQGSIQDVNDTAFDFLNSGAQADGRAITQALESGDSQIKLVGGIDHTFIENNTGNGLEKIAQLYSEKTKLALSVYTTQKAVHVYTGNYLRDKFKQHAGICFETQGFPDAPNHENFNSALLKAGATYQHKTTYQLEFNSKTKD